MEISRNRIILSLFIIIFCYSCGDIPSTDELDKDIQILETQIQSAKENSEQYSGGLIKVLIDMRTEILRNTKAMLDQKKSGIKRFINMKYTIDGRGYDPPKNKDELLTSLQEDINSNQAKKEEVRKQSERYAGGLFKVMLESQMATIDASIATLEQRKLFLKYDIPLYAMMPDKGLTDKESEFKATPGEDMDKL
jgi:hypothetical protein